MASSLYPQKKRGGRPGRGRRNRRPAANPLVPVVNADIAGQVAPLAQRIRYADDQYNKEQQLGNTLRTAQQGELGRIGSDLAANTGSQLNLAAAQNTAQGDQLARNMAFLKGVFGDQQTAGQTAAIGGSGDFTGQQNLTNNVGTAALIGLNNQAAQRDLASMRSAENMRINQFKEDSSDRRAKVTNDANWLIRDIKAQAPSLLWKYTQQQNAMNLEAKRLGLDEKQFAEGVRQYNASLAENQRQFDQGMDYNGDGVRDDFQDPGKTKAADPSVYGYGAEKDATIQQILGNFGQSLLYWHMYKSGKTDSKTGEKVPNPFQYGGPFRDLYHNLHGAAGLTPDQAAVLAAKNAPPESFASSTPHDWYKMLSGMGVSNAAAKQIIVDHFGINGWRSRNAKFNPAPGGFRGDQNNKRTPPKKKHHTKKKQTQSLSDSLANALRS